MPLAIHDPRLPKSTAPFIPKAKAKEMFAQFGKVAALSKVMDEIQNAHKEGEYYALSLWREVRRELDGQAVH